MTEQRYVPALGRGALNALYDPTMRLTMRERRWRPAVLDAALDGDGRDVLDLGCGTGTLAIDLARAGARVIGVDGDEDILRRAAAKARDAGVALDLRRGLADAIPVDERGVDAVVCSLLWHHLVPEDKVAGLRECHRVLRPGGRLVIADWGRPTGPVQRAAFFGVQLLDGFENTRDHAAGRLPGFIRDAGFTGVVVDRRLRTAFGTLEVLRAAA